jgi:hypothetical protein
MRDVHLLCATPAFENPTAHPHLPTGNSVTAQRRPEPASGASPMKGQTRMWWRLLKWRKAGSVRNGAMPAQRRRSAAASGQHRRGQWLTTRLPLWLACGGNIETTIDLVGGYTRSSDGGREHGLHGIGGQQVSQPGSCRALMLAQCVVTEGVKWLWVVVTWTLGSRKSVTTTTTAAATTNACFGVSKDPKSSSVTGAAPRVYGERFCRRSAVP